MKDMQLYLKIIAGEPRGASAPLRDGLSLGRKGTDLNIRDSKASSLHATVEQRPDGWYLVDQGSTNGIKSANERVKELPLVIGTQFTIGRTTLKVISGEMALAPEAPADLLPGEDPADPAKEDPAEVDLEASAWIRQSWKDTIVQRVRQASGLPTTQTAVAPFEPPLRLKIVGGPQTGTEWVLGYGPREVGSASLDLPLFELGLGPAGFRLLPQHKGIIFKTDQPEQVRLNGKRVDTGLLRDGDVIQIKNTRIQVLFEHGE